MVATRQKFGGHMDNTKPVDQLSNRCTSFPIYYHTMSRREGFYAYNGGYSQKYQHHLIITLRNRSRANADRLA